jgi:hypothetical protein
VQLTTIACILLSQLPTILVGQFVERRVLVLVLAVEWGVVRLLSTTIYWEDNLRVIRKMIMFYVVLLRLDIAQRAAEFLQVAMGDGAEPDTLVQQLDNLGLEGDRWVLEIYRLALDLKRLQIVIL